MSLLAPLGSFDGRRNWDRGGRRVARWKPEFDSRIGYHVVESKRRALHVIGGVAYVNTLVILV